MIAAVPPPLVDVRPTREVRTVAAVNEVAVDGGRAATLVGAAQAWEYLLVWSPKGVVVRASLACDTQESNVVLAGNRFAHVCFQSANYVVTGTVKPLRGRVALRAAGSAQVSLAGAEGLVAGSLDRTVWRFDAAARHKLRTYPKPAIALSVDRGRVLVDREPTKLDVLSGTGSVVATLRRRHDGGAVMRAGLVASLSGQRLTVSNLRGRLLRARTIAAGARLEDFDGGLALYSVETRLYLLRLRDGHEVRLRLRGQYGYAHARVAAGALYYAYNGKSGRLGHAGFVAAARVRSLLGP